MAAARCPCRCCRRPGLKRRARNWLAAAVVLLITAGFAVDRSSQYNSLPAVLCHPLHLSTYFAKEGVVEFLLDQGLFAADTRNAHGQTALHVAAHRGKDWAATILLKAGASPSALDRRGATPLALARASYSTERCVPPPAPASPPHAPCCPRSPRSPRRLPARTCLPACLPVCLPAPR
eukprot:SAG22_NODE_4392_length_1284_cov_1.705485_1_plen_178_part_00